MRLPSSSRFLALLLIVCATSCALFGPLETSSSSVQNIRSAGVDEREAQANTLRRMVERLAERARGRRSRELDVLLLSGGGQHGAYGMGFLRGWQERGAGVFPEFDLVTGVGSGALQAPFAMIGTQAALNRGAELYRESTIALASGRDLWFELRESKQGISAGPYVELMQRAIDEELQEALEPLYEQKRQVMVATTDLDLGIQRIWDFGRELGGAEHGLARARALLTASASVPGAMEPLLIDNHIHASGNVFGNVLIPFEFDDFRTLAQRLRALGVSDTVELRVWVIINGFCRAREYEVDPEDRRALGVRADQLAFIAEQAALIEHLTALAHSVNAGVRGLRMQLHLTAIPDELADASGSTRAYDEGFMMELEQVGYNRAGSAAAWDRVVLRDYDDE